MDGKVKQFIVFVDELLVFMASPVVSLTCTVEKNRQSIIVYLYSNLDLILIPIYRGFLEIIIGFEENYLKCPSCEVDTEHEMLIVSKYFHLYTLPMLPTGKEVHTHCLKCGLRRNNIPLEKQFFTDYEDLKKKYKHPWITKIVPAIAILIILTLILFETTPTAEN